MDTQAATSIIRWIHMISGAAWLGEVGAVVFVLSPVLVRLGSERRGWFLATVFPRIFRLASVLSATAVTAGALLFLATSGWRLDLGRLVDGRWGISILIGGTLGLALTIFHFVVEGRLEPIVRAADDGTIDDDRLVRFLTIVPRIGLGVLVVVFTAMIYASRGI